MSSELIIITLFAVTAGWLGGYFTGKSVCGVSREKIEYAFQHGVVVGRDSSFITLGRMLDEFSQDQVCGFIKDKAKEKEKYVKKIKDLSE